MSSRGGHDLSLRVLKNRRGHRRGWVLAGLIQMGGALGLWGQDIPPDRPRARPPSELTGWADWERGETLLKRIQVPPAPALPPDQALQTFRLAPGYRIELVASEPMVQNPIFFEFDPDGRIWVVEYQGYMRDLAGRGEADLICRVVVLEDTDADGRADRSKVFLEDLAMPRSLTFVKGGVLVAEPPHLWLCRDQDGDLRCDEKTEVGRYGKAGNPQHTANGLRYGIDNWLHSADWPKRHRLVQGGLEEEETVHRGQFGVTFDDYGRFLSCYESSPLHADLIPAHYLLRNPQVLKARNRTGADRAAFGVSVNIAAQAREVYPIRVTPAITLGALELREDGRLRTYTVVSGVCYYNGHQFPADALGNVFVPESGGHLVGRLRLAGDLQLTATRHYPAEREFLASTDERFRPVNSRVGPDGALYVADMYHGIIEHVIFMVPWLERQVRDRRLEEGNDLGRIYRVVYESNPIDRRSPRLSTATSAQLLEHLNHSNGWWRLTAQRLLVERRDPSILPALRDRLKSLAQPRARLHALWTLHGMEALEDTSVLRAMKDLHPWVRATAVRLAEDLLRHPPPVQPRAPGGTHPRLVSDRFPAEAMDALRGLSGDPSPLVRIQVLLSLGSLPPNLAWPVMAAMVDANDLPLFCTAALTGLGGKELEFLAGLRGQPIWQHETPARSRLIHALTQAILDEAVSERVSRLFDMLEADANTLPWRGDAMWTGLLDALPRDLQRAPLVLPSEPRILTERLRSDDEDLRREAYRLVTAFAWAGSAVAPFEPDTGTPLTAAERHLAERGRSQYLAACAACHQPDGAGLLDVAPPLAASEWVSGSPERLARILLHGLYGPIEVAGQRWDRHMPGFGAALNDDQIAGVLTYIRHAWGNSAGAVTPALVARTRQVTALRTGAWNAEELLGVALPQDGKAAVWIRPDTRGELVLPAKLAHTHGRELGYRPSLDVLAPWRQEQDIAEWQVEIQTAGHYEVRIQLAADEASAGDRFWIETATSRVEGSVANTGGYQRFEEYGCGTIRLEEGRHRIVLRPAGELRKELADVRGLRLIPAKPAIRRP